MSEPRWLTLLEVRAFARIVTLETTGEDFRPVTKRVLKAALAAPQELWAGGERDLFVLAATYGVEIARTQPFNEGNKRTGTVAMLDFLQRCGCGRPQPEAQHALIEPMIRAKEGAITARELAEIVRGLPVLGRGHG